MRFFFTKRGSSQAEVLLIVLSLLTTLMALVSNEGSSEIAMSLITNEENVNLEKQGENTSEDVNANIQPPAELLPTSGAGYGDSESETTANRKISNRNIPLRQPRPSDISERVDWGNWKSENLSWPSAKENYWKNDIKLRIQIKEILSNGDFFERLDIKCHDFSNYHWIDILELLNVPLTVTGTRLITLNIKCPLDECSNLIEALNSSLQIDPTFWLACDTRFCQQRSSRPTRTLYFEFRPLDPTFCIIGRYIAIVRQKATSNGAPVNVILVVSHHDWTLSDMYSHLWFEADTLPILLESKEEHVFSDFPPYTSESWYLSSQGWSDMYSGLLRKEIQAGCPEEITK